MQKAAPDVAEKLSALRGLSKHLGIIGKRRHVSPNEVVDRDLAFQMAVGAAFGLMAPNREWWQRSACAVILDILSPDWRSDASPEILGRIVARDSLEVRRWREAVLARDEKSCRHCGSTERLHAHHVLRWADVPEARVAVENGVTLCEACHVVEHHGSRDVSQTDTSSGGEADR